MRGLEGKTVIVTGGGGAIGRAICLRMAEEGCKVAVFDLDAEAAEATAKLVQDAGSEAHAAICDISDRAAVEKAVAETEAALGPIGILVNNAGWDRFMNFLDTDEELQDRVMAINLKGPINMHHVVLKGMAERGSGAVVNIASDAGRVGSSGEAVYSACKGGIIAFTKTMAREMARGGVRLNAIAPGPTDTPLLRSFVGESEAGQKVYEGLKRAIPMKRLGEPEDIPGAVAFLASDEAGYITGQIISISGGLTMHG